jgi:RsiW-degrading membrane proteinase PrsW (M82 family)
MLESTEGSGRGSRTLEDTVILACALLFFALAVVLIGFVLIATAYGKAIPISEWWYVFFVVLAAWLGFSLIRALRVGRSEVIPRQDRAVLDAALQKAPDPVEEYIKLSGLIGVTGFFRKLEFSGMPLATILMTLILCLLSLLTPVLGKQFDLQMDDVGKGFLELAKLTLGAFIGSFVARTGDQRSRTLPGRPGQAGSGGGT